MHNTLAQKPVGKTDRHIPYQVDVSSEYDSDFIENILSDWMGILLKGFVGKNIDVITVDPPSAKISTEAASTTSVSWMTLLMDKRGAVYLPPKTLLKLMLPACVLSIENWFVFLSKAKINRSFLALASPMVKLWLAAASSFSMYWPDTLPISLLKSNPFLTFMFS